MSEARWHLLLQFVSQPSTWVAVLLPLTLSLLWVARAALRGCYPPWLAVLWLASIALSQALSRWVVDEHLRSLHVVSVFSVAALLTVFLRVRVDLGLAFGLTHLALLLVDVLEAARYAVAHDEWPAGFFLGIGGAGLYDGLLLFPVCTVAALAYSRRRFAQARTPSCGSS